MCAYWVRCALRGGAHLVGWLGCIVSLLGRTWVARVGEAGQAGPVQLGHAGMEKGGGEKEWLAGPGSASSSVSAHCRIGVRKSFFFFQSFHNLQTNLNSIQI
jgi:hypothetical protein